MLAKVFPIKLKDGMQARAEAIVQEFAPKGPGVKDGTLSFRVYRDPARADYLLFVEHFADQAACAVAARATRELLVDGIYDSTADGIPYDKTNDALASRPAIQEAR